MKITYLDYYKMILGKVSFDSNLVRKEYQKALRALPPHEMKELNRWAEAKGIMAPYFLQSRAA
jgi:hypothetical protein